MATGGDGAPQMAVTNMGALPTNPDACTSELGDSCRAAEVLRWGLLQVSRLRQRRDDASFIRLGRHASKAVM